VPIGTKAPHKGASMSGLCDLTPPWRNLLADYRAVNPPAQSNALANAANTLRVWNIVGTSANRCNCGSWIDHWSRFSGSVPYRCSVYACMNMPEVGGHVKKVGSSDNSWYVVPLCTSCNARNGELTHRFTGSAYIGEQKRHVRQLRFRGLNLVSLVRPKKRRLRSRCCLEPLLFQAARTSRALPSRRRTMWPSRFMRNNHLDTVASLLPPQRRDRNFCAGIWPPTAMMASTSPSAAV